MGCLKVKITRCFGADFFDFPRTSGVSVRMTRSDAARPRASWELARPFAALLGGLANLTQTVVTNMIEHKRTTTSQALWSLGTGLAGRVARTINPKTNLGGPR